MLDELIHLHDIYVELDKRLRHLSGIMPKNFDWIVAERAARDDVAAFFDMVVDSSAFKCHNPIAISLAEWALSC